MNTYELRNNFHHLIDSISNDELLSRFYSIILRMKEQPDGALWRKLTKEEQEELLKSDMEANDLQNLIPHSEEFKKNIKNGSDYLLVKEG